MDIKDNHTQLQPVTHNEHAVQVQKRKVWISSYILFAVICFAVYLLFKLTDINVLGTYKPLVLKLAMAGFVSFVVLIATKFIEGFIIKRSHTKAIQYNLVQLTRFISIVMVLLVIISFLNSNWYTAAVSLGLISLILGFALQTPIASLIGWFYIIIRAPYKVGDRIQVDTFTGDVVEIGYFDTTLWEFAGTYMTSDLPSGRLIRFPNSLIFADAVYNYSWKRFPYIWNEIPFHVAYESDLDFVEKTIRDIAREEMGEDMETKVRELRNTIQHTPVDELEVKEFPFVNFRINANTWVEVLLIYLVEPKQAAATRTRLIKRILAELLKAPDKALFPKTNNR